MFTRCLDLIAHQKPKAENPGHSGLFVPKLLLVWSDQSFQLSNEVEQDMDKSKEVPHGKVIIVSRTGVPWVG
jgi:hypothetical protein